MKQIEFSDKNAASIYSSYIKEVKKAIKVLSEEDQEDILMELNSHIYESLQDNPSLPEADRMAETVNRLGNPKETFAPMVAERKLTQATRTFNPLHVVKALSLNVSNGFIYILFSVLYLLLFSFVFLIFAKLFYPENTGLFVDQGKIQFGFISDIAHLSSTEVAGNWFIPAVMLVMVVLYFAITLLLRLKRIMKKK